MRMMLHAGCPVGVKVTVMGPVLLKFLTYTDQTVAAGSGTVFVPLMVWKNGSKYSTRAASVGLFNERVTICGDGESVVSVVTHCACKMMERLAIFYLTLLYCPYNSTYAFRIAYYRVCSCVHAQGQHC